MARNSKSVGNALVPVGAQAFALSPGSLGSIDAYIQAVNRVPMLTPEEELRLAREFRDNDNLDSAGRLVMSHLRLVVAVARNYLGYGLAHAELIQEGNIGLMKAVKRFDPERGVRLVSFALHWIKAEIHEYVLKNWRLVKVATTKAQRKLFFNLRSMKQGLGTMSQDQVGEIARELNVKAAPMTARRSSRRSRTWPTPIRSRRKCFSVVNTTCCRVTVYATPFRSSIPAVAASLKRVG